MHYVSLVIGNCATHVSNPQTSQPRPSCGELLILGHTLGAEHLYRPVHYIRSHGRHGELGEQSVKRIGLAGNALP